MNKFEIRIQDYQDRQDIAGILFRAGYKVSERQQSHNRQPCVAGTDYYVVAEESDVMKDDAQV